MLKETLPKSDRSELSGPRNTVRDTCAGNRDICKICFDFDGVAWTRIALMSHVTVSSASRFVHCWTSSVIHWSNQNMHEETGKELETPFFSLTLTLKSKVAPQTSTHVLATLQHVRVPKEKNNSRHDTLQQTVGRNSSNIPLRSWTEKTREENPPNGQITQLSFTHSNCWVYLQMREENNVLRGELGTVRESCAPASTYQQYIDLIRGLVKKVCCLD